LIADYPILISENAMAQDPNSGWIYSVGGISNQAFTANSYVYKPTSDTWSPIADLPMALEKPVAAFIGGKLYVTAGWSKAARKANKTVKVYIYDPGSNTWVTGAHDDPNYHLGGAGSAVLNGKLYVIGGCLQSFCTGTKKVDVYDPASDTWSSAADYPHTDAWLACAGLNDRIYCAGGATFYGRYKDGYVYNPVSNSWSPIADLPNTWFGMAAMGGETYGLVIAQGEVGGSITNQAKIYNPGSNSWSPLPNALYPEFRAAGACGFYSVGGNPFNGTPISEELVGYNHCAFTPIPWLTVAPATATLTVAATSNVTLTFDGTGQQAFTTSKAQMFLTGNTPYSRQRVPLTVYWDPQLVHLVITGVANPSPVQKGNNLVYTVTVENQQMTNHGAATQTVMAYQLPAGVSYVASSGGDASCTTQSSTVSCAFGTIALGASKAVTIVVTVADAGTLTSIFNVVYCVTNK
jgi:hypothetical protein